MGSGDLGGERIGRLISTAPAAAAGEAATPALLAAALSDFDSAGWGDDANVTDFFSGDDS
jgi:hypothetical protein